MKKTSLLVTVPALALCGLLLAGCGMFRSHKAWETAVQESPLEIPPGLDTPSAAAALNIPPPGANQPTANGARATVGAAAGEVSDGFIAEGPIDTVYRKVGRLLEEAKVGRVVSHDDAAHSYTVAVAGASAKKRGFFGRLFHREKRNDATASGGAVQQVVVSVGDSGTYGSEVRAKGGVNAVGVVIDSLKKKLGK
jgi:uncharacterized lipoprotein